MATRYSRTEMLPEIGTEGQKKLANARVAIVGAGALGGCAAICLTAAGLGTIAIADFDNVDLSNLPRQTAYSTADVGLPKVHALAKRLTALNPGVNLQILQSYLSKRNIDSFLEGSDVVIEGSDNPATKSLVTTRCTALGIPCVAGGVDGFRGQVISFNAHPAVPYDDIFGKPATTCSLPEPGHSILPCGGKGVFPTLPTIIAGIQASEAMKIITGVGAPLYGRIFTLDILSGISQTIKIL